VIIDYYRFAASFLHIMFFIIPDCAPDDVGVVELLSVLLLRVPLFSGPTAPKF
jgi:hypothetical protein